jgi:hypothetical protein
MAAAICACSGSRIVLEYWYGWRGGRDSEQSVIPSAGRMACSYTRALQVGESPLLVAQVLALSVTSTGLVILNTGGAMHPFTIACLVCE